MSWFVKKCSCGERIVMAKDEDNRWQPLDYDSTSKRDPAAVLFVLDLGQPNAVARKVEDRQALRPSDEVHASHFQSCPDADRHSSGGGRRGGVTL